MARQDGLFLGFIPVEMVAIVSGGASFAFGLAAFARYKQSGVENLSEQSAAFFGDLAISAVLAALLVVSLFRYDSYQKSVHQQLNPNDLLP